ncbi:MAG: peptidase [bacterium]
MRSYRRAFLIPLLILVLPLWLSCGGQKSEPSEEAKTTGEAEEAEMAPVLPEHLPNYDIKVQLRKYAKVEIGYDDAFLSAPEKEALGKLIKAAHMMDEIFLRQVWSGNVALLDTLDRIHHYSHEHKYSEIGKNHDLIVNLLQFFRINFGPWDRLEGNAPFIGTMPKPAGANFYPEDMTKEEFESFLADHPDQTEAFVNFFTVIRRQNSELAAVPYSQEYRELLEMAATYLQDAADILTKPENKTQFTSGIDYTTLAAYLRSRADAFMSNDYMPSDMDWMDVENNILDVTIGPYEVYEDLLFGYKASFEAFIAMRHPEDSKKLEGIKRFLPKLESSLPIPDEHKNPNRGTESPVSVVDLVYAGGDTKAGVQTIAFNLPNDERVREAKGSKKVMLKNISRAKFDKILVPIAEQVLDPKQMDDLVFEAYFNNTLMHEVSHGLGPGKIMKDGTETTVNLELQDLYSGIEEAKADIVGLFSTRVLLQEGFLEKGIDKKGYVCFLPGFFRAIRFGTTSAHAKANMMEFNFIREQGGITLDPNTGKFHVNTDKMPAAVEALANKLLMIEALGDYEGAKAFIDKYSAPSPDLEKLLAKLDKIPVDIEPIYSAEAVYLEPSEQWAVHPRPRVESHNH